MLIETTTFRLSDGVGEADFLEADARVQTEFVYQQHGCVRRMTARSAADEWIVVTFWGTDQDAIDAASAADTDPAWRAFMGSIDPSTLRVARHSTLD